MFLRNAWYLAGPTSQLDVAAMFPITIVGQPLVIYRGDNGKIVALEDRCVHRMAPLSLGRIEGNNLRCMYHGLLFDQTGKAIEIPGQDTIPSRACVKCHAVEEQSGWIWVWMGDADQADLGLLPPVQGFSNPDWMQRGGSLDYDANYELINNNLTDLGHLAWVHVASFGADATWTDTIPEVTPLPNGVRINRWLRNIAPIPPLGGAAALERCDQWAQLDYYVPGVFSFYNAVYPCGTADRYDGGEPDQADPAMAFEHYTQQAVTPMTERTSRYFFTWGPSTRHGNDEIAAIMEGAMYMAFGEDKVIIEGQQKIIDADPTRQPMPTVHDKGVVLFQRLMQRLIREQGEEK
jgi:phenylpropionate dioxygenase-like ring-hydroxylating dioxygenase large terminal subunit